MNKKEIAYWFENLQDEICIQLEKIDQKGKFTEDKWERSGGGGGKSRIIQNGNIIEKGGVNFSAVHGETPEKILEALQIDKADFFATGISIVLHPSNPWVPVIHMNLRYFEMSNSTYWFGGGIDLTPHYVNKEEASQFHRQLKKVCDLFDPKYYEKFKKWADDYFFIRHRGETRGIGGIFFDRLTASESKSKADVFKFVQEVGRVFIPVYKPIVTANGSKPFTQEEKKWQAYRRGRYVEFNLVNDKGTKFGLDTNGRTESILMSLPPNANWLYNYIPETGTREEKTVALLKKEIDWINM